MDFIESRSMGFGGSINFIDREAFWLYQKMADDIMVNAKGREKKQDTGERGTARFSLY